MNIFILSFQTHTGTLLASYQPASSFQAPHVFREILQSTQAAGNGPSKAIKEDPSWGTRRANEKRKWKGGRKGNRRKGVKGDGYRKVKKEIREGKGKRRKES